MTRTGILIGNIFDWLKKVTRFVVTFSDDYRYTSQENELRDESPEARDLNSKHSNESCVLKNCVNDIKYSDRGRITIV